MAIFKILSIHLISFCYRATGIIILTVGLFMYLFVCFVLAGLPVHKYYCLELHEKKSEDGSLSEIPLNCESDPIHHLDTKNKIFWICSLTYYYYMPVCRFALSECSCFTFCVNYRLAVILFSIVGSQNSGSGFVFWGHLSSY